MTLTELQELIVSKGGIKICPICGTPFNPYHSRQVTCATKECKKAHHRAWIKEHNARLKEEDPERYRITRNGYMKKYRKRLAAKERRFEDIEKAIKKERAFEGESPASYRDRQIAETLKNVPKIELTLMDKRKGKK